MANSTIRIPRGHLIMALCLPLAVLIGYFLAEPFDISSLSLVLMVLGVLAIPLLMKWHHPLLVLSWNASLTFPFIRGDPILWMLMTAASLFIAVLNRAVDPDKRFLAVPALTRSVAFLVAVIIGTALVTGGAGLAVFGSNRQGGKGYLELLIALAGYFALTSERIPPRQAWLYTGLFFLPQISAVIGTLIYFAGPQFYFLYKVFPMGSSLDQFGMNESLRLGEGRYGSLGSAAGGIYGYLLGRHGLRGVFDFTKPWRFLGFLVAAAACLLSGYRAFFVLFLLTMTCLFVVEGLWRSRALPVWAGTALVVAALTLPFAYKLPPMVQRTISFLPAKLEPGVRDSARGTTEWRLEMWKLAAGQIPKYLVKGKGYGVDPNDLYMAEHAAWMGYAPASEISAMAGDYHNGPLSVIIPFGVLGVAGFLWFLAVGFRVLYCNYRYGDPAVVRVNGFLLALFTSKALFFLFIFGSLKVDLWAFTGLVGLSVSLNGGVSQPAPQEEVGALEELEPA